MNNELSTRQLVAELLTALFGDENKGIIFKAKDITKRSGGKKSTKYELETSSGWNAKSNGEEPTHVTCLGMTMTEFIKDCKNNNISFVQSSRLIEHITVFKNEPIFKTEGCVEQIDYQNNKLILSIIDLPLMGKINVPISSKTPSWLYKSDNRQTHFRCKIPPGWRALNTSQNLNWTKIWKTFKPFDPLSSWYCSERVDG